MTPEEKELLLKDLCVRLPYITYYDLSYYGHKTRSVLQEFIPAKESLKSLVKVNTVVEPIPYENIKPYLRPMSSMTKEEENEFISLNAIPSPCQLPNHTRMNWYSNATMLDWLNTHHFDYRGLIKKGLALEAPECMYKEE